MAWQCSSLTPAYPKQLKFQMSSTCFVVSALPRIHVGSSVTLWLICWLLKYSLCCKCCLVTLAFHVPFMSFLATEKVRLKQRPQLYQETRNITSADVGCSSSAGYAVTNTRGLMWFLNHQQHPQFCISCLWLEIRVVFISGEKRAGQERKQKSTYKDLRTAWRWKKKQAVKTLPLNDGARDKTNKCSAALEDGK